MIGPEVDVEVGKQTLTIMSNERGALALRQKVQSQQEKGKSTKFCSPIEVFLTNPNEKENSTSHAKSKNQVKGVACEGA